MFTIESFMVNNEEQVKSKSPFGHQIEGFTLNLKMEISPIELSNRLALLGYRNISPATISSEGEFSKRGGLVDIWLERYKLPVRIDLISDKIENIYLFNILTQERTKNLKQVYIVVRGITPRLAPKWVKGKKFPIEKGKYERLFLSEIQPGDLVVHIDHGIGKFVGVGSGFDLPTTARQTRLPPTAKTPRFSAGYKGSTKNRLEAGLAQTDVETVGEQSRSPFGVNEESLAQTGDKIAGKQTFAHPYLLVEYAKGDKLYVPVQQIERLTKYIGSGKRKPPLSHLGTSGWERTRRKVEENVAAYAKELLMLYAKRQTVSRIPYSLDTPWQRELEESFEYQETADQLKATEGIKKDLESPHPMDRLLVGDVGFGKTEVAVRAAFKVVQDNKQVAVLVPTTVLAEQHFHLFKERLANFPVEVGKLSRFSAKENEKKVLAGIKNGSIDIVIGTHRLLSSDVEFKNLGLLIIDEEHRFGVKAKEKIKTFEPTVDVLAMSATPIPRTLQMTLAKIREMSLLNQAPLGRRPISTFVGKYDLEKVKIVLEKEIARCGQVYYVYNRVEDIVEKAAQIQRLVPRARVTYAHGQMDSTSPKLRGASQNLEKVMQEFYDGEQDVLVCTTIIGSGLDMPNVNTIIIEDAHLFGLADLYQLRGRVGRSSREAYACLFFPEKLVPEGQILERLLAITQAKELGSGFQLARQDLEIRGAGNILGTAQHGNVSLVGFELYLQLLAQAVEKLKTN